jgi:hypothetical protein
MPLGEKGMNVSPNFAALTGAAMQTDSKTARMAADLVVPAPNSRLVQRFADLRKVLRSSAMRQSGAKDAPNNKTDPAKASIFFLDGEAHRAAPRRDHPLFHAQGDCDAAHAGHAAIGRCACGRVPN